MLSLKKNTTDKESYSNQRKMTHPPLITHTCIYITHQTTLFSSLPPPSPPQTLLLAGSKEVLSIREKQFLAH